MYVCLLTCRCLSVTVIGEIVIHLLPLALASLLCLFSAHCIALRLFDSVEGRVFSFRVSFISPFVLPVMEVARTPSSAERLLREAVDAVKLRDYMEKSQMRLDVVQEQVVAADEDISDIKARVERIADQLARRSKPTRAPTASSPRLALLAQPKIAVLQPVQATEQKPTASPRGRIPRPSPPRSKIPVPRLASVPAPRTSLESSPIRSARSASAHTPSRNRMTPTSHLSGASRRNAPRSASAMTGASAATAASAAAAASAPMRFYAPTGWKKPAGCGALPTDTLQLSHVYVFSSAMFVCVCMLFLLIAVVTWLSLRFLFSHVCLFSLALCLYVFCVSLCVCAYWVQCRRRRQ